MASLIEQAIAEEFRKRTSPTYKYDVDPKPQGYTEEVSRDVPAYAGITASQAAFSGKEVVPLEGTDKMYDPDTRVTFTPQDVEFTPEGKYRVKSWGNRFVDQIKKYPTTKKKVPSYTDANIKTTETPAEIDLKTPEGVQKGTNMIAQMGGKPGNYGMPSVAEAMKLPGELEKQKSDMANQKSARKGDFKTAVQIRGVFEKFKLPYDTKKTYGENWDVAVDGLDPEMKSQFIQAGLEAMNPTKNTETALIANAKAIAQSKGITEEQAMDQLMHLKGKTREQYILDTYNAGMSRHGMDNVAREEAEAAGAFYDSTNGVKKAPLREEMNAAKQVQSTMKSKSGRPMVKDPNSPSGWSYAQ